MFLLGDNDAGALNYGQEHMACNEELGRYRGWNGKAGRCESLEHCYENKKTVELHTMAY